MSMTFTDMKNRADYIGGEIKQADADVVEATVMRERAEKALETAKDYEAKAIVRAAEKRAERDALADNMAAYVKCQGEASNGHDPSQPVSEDQYHQAYTNQPIADGAGEVSIDGWRP